VQDLKNVNYKQILKVRGEAAMKKIYLYGIYVCFLLLFTPVVSYADHPSGQTQAEVTFTQGPKRQESKKDEPNPNVPEKDDPIGKVFPKGVLPSTGEQRGLYLMIIGITLIFMIGFVVQVKRKIESRRNK
jgi:LPXTG-motif cell wall-anchored protein